MFSAFPSREHAGRELALRLKSMAIGVGSISATASLFR